MAKFEYEVLVGIDYPPNNRAEAGDIVSDLPKDSIAWLIESNIIKPIDNKKSATFTSKTVDTSDKFDSIEKEVDDEL